MASYPPPDSEFDADEVTTSWFGLSFVQDRRKLKSGGYANGLLIVDVQANSPAAKAGLQPPIEGKAREAAEMATLAAGVVFPPAMLGVAVISSTQLDQSYEMIIGVDGDRITNILDFDNHLRVVQPGEIIYLNIVRDGIRQQVPVYIPPDTDTRYRCDLLPCFSPP
jgi:S1-C subfamily serine protease